MLSILVFILVNSIKTADDTKITVSREGYDEEKNLAKNGNVPNPPRLFRGTDATKSKLVQLSQLTNDQPLVLHKALDLSPYEKFFEILSQHLIAQQNETLENAEVIADKPNAIALEAADKSENDKVVQSSQSEKSKTSKHDYEEVNDANQSESSFENVEYIHQEVSKHDSHEKSESHSTSVKDAAKQESVVNPSKKTQSSHPGSASQRELSSSMSITSESSEKHEDEDDSTESAFTVKLDSN